jgi:enoyl-CoA hydratase/carnithine racemase
MSQVLLTERQGAVMVLTHHNPSVRNALSPEFYAALTAALKAAEADDSVGAVVLTGAEGMFCSGGDLRQLIKRRELPLPERRERLEGLHDLIRCLRDCPKPVIAAVEGAAAGAGLSIALACDMLVSARDAIYSVAYVKVGLTPDGGATAFLAEFVSRQVLTELCLTGERFNGERLHTLGAVNRLTEPGQALEQAVALAQQIAQGPARATARIKDLCRAAPQATLEEQLQREAEHMVQSQGDTESLEGIGAFLDKRKPDFLQLRSPKI